jgi:hypothetical protein
MGREVFHTWGLMRESWDVGLVGSGSVRAGTASGQQRAKSVCVGVIKCKKALNLRRMSLLIGGAGH